MARVIYPFANPGQYPVYQRFGSGPGIYAYEPPLVRGGPPFHRGVDLSPMAAGTPIYAVFDGTTEYAGLDPDGAGFNGGYGLMVGIVAADGVYASLCAHLSGIVVAKGDTVKQGQHIGNSGGGGPSGPGTNSGNSTGEHLHWGLNNQGSVFNDGGWINPLPVVGDGTSLLAGGGVAPTPPGDAAAPGYITPGQAVYYARNAGVPEGQLATCVAIAMAESSLRLAAVSGAASDGTVGRGIWQIESSHGGYDAARLLSDPAYNAAAMAALSLNGVNWHAWTTYGYVGVPPTFVGWGKGSYKDYLPVATAAVRDTPPGLYPSGLPNSGAGSPGSGTLITQPSTVSQDTSPELPPDVAAIFPVTIDRSQLMYQQGLTPAAAVFIGRAALPVESVSVTTPTYRVPGKWTAKVPMRAFDNAVGEAALANLFAKRKTQVVISMGYLPAPIDVWNLADVFTGLAIVSEATYAGDWITLDGPDLSGIFSGAGDTASKLDDFVNMSVDDAVRTIVTRYAGDRIAVSIDPAAGTVGGLYGQNATQTRTPIRTAWDLLTQLCESEGLSCYMDGTTLVARRIPDGTVGALRLAFRRAGTVMDDPVIRPAKHSKRDYLVAVGTYDTRQGQTKYAYAGNHDVGEPVTLFLPPNATHDQLQKRANAVDANYIATEYQTTIRLSQPLAIAPLQPVIVDGSSGHACDRYLIGSGHPYYLASPTLTYSRQEGLRMSLILTSRPPGVMDASQAGLVSG